MTAGTFLSLFGTLLLGALLGFIFSGERNPLTRVGIVALFLTFLAALLGPAGRTAVIALLFAISFYYGWVIRKNAGRIESIRNRMLFYFVAMVLALIVMFAIAIFLGR